ncbi:MAG: polysaccharide deacetylase family protein [Oscillospiraceae bacterium]|nr:polysaccharide deacetylase family protein [Oscillospiraceae bacterium]
MRFCEQAKKKAITFSYDDGMTQDVRLIELLNKYGLKSTFNLNSQLLGTGKVEMRRGKRVSRYRLSPMDVKKVYEGHEIAVHTLSHPNLVNCYEEEIIRQVEKDRLALSELAGYEVVGMAYPSGLINCDDRVADVIRKHTGVLYARTLPDTHSFDMQEDLLQFHPTVYHLDFEKMMELGREFVALDAETPKVFYIWGHSYEMDYSDDFWLQLEEFFKLISHKDDIFYGTNKEVLL